MEKHNFPVKFVCLNMNFSCMETSVCPKIQSLSVGKLKSIFRELIDLSCFMECEKCGSLTVSASVSKYKCSD